MNFNIIYILLSKFTKGAIKSATPASLVHFPRKHLFLKMYITYYYYFIIIIASKSRYPYRDFPNGERTLGTRKIGNLETRACNPWTGGERKILPPPYPRGMEKVYLLPKDWKMRMIPSYREQASIALNKQSDWLRVVHFRKPLRVYLSIW